MADAGRALGLPEELASRLAVETVSGSALLASASDESPAELADRVASPGGTTREGLNRLDAADGIRPLLRQTLEAAARRSAELAAAARQSSHSGAGVFSFAALRRFHPASPLQGRHDPPCSERPHQHHNLHVKASHPHNN